jgi:hypothetical protein
MDQIVTVSAAWSFWALTVVIPVILLAVPLVWLVLIVRELRAEVRRLVAALQPKSA